MSVNEHRRHMNKGQRAMVAAKICILNIQTTRKAADSTGISHSAIGHARVVLEYAPELADQVIAGNMFLSKAYEEAQSRKQKASSIESRLEKLRKVSRWSARAAKLQREAALRSERFEPFAG